MIMNTNTVFFQINASFQVHDLDTVESILNQVNKIIIINHKQFQKIFQAIKAALYSQDQCMQNQNQEIINLHAINNEFQTQITNLNVYIVQLMRNLIKIHIIEQKKKLIAHS